LKDLKEPAACKKHSRWMNLLQESWQQLQILRNSNHAIHELLKFEWSLFSLEFEKRMYEKNRTFSSSSRINRENTLKVLRKIKGFSKENTPET
jgi:hypothetical protein